MKTFMLVVVLVFPATAFASTLEITNAPVLQQVNGGGWESFRGFVPALSVYDGSNVFFDSFGPNHQLGQGGWVVSGSANSSLWAGNTVQTAISFTSAMLISQFQIDIPLQLRAGTNTFLLTLHPDSNGVPGPTLAQWQITNAAPFGDGSPSFGGFETVTGTTPLQGESVYWVVASPLAPQSDTDGAWRVSPFLLSMAPTPLPEPSSVYLPVGLALLSLLAHRRVAKPVL